jgi:hypothetical protein
MDSTVQQAIDDRIRPRIVCTVLGLHVGDVDHDPHGHDSAAAAGAETDIRSSDRGTRRQHSGSPP